MEKDYKKNMETNYNRTIESVLDLKTGKEIFASNFFQKPIDEIFRLRYEYESEIRENKIRYVCYFCRQIIKIRGQSDSKKILHFAHLKDSDECPIKTNNKYTKDEILRIKYNGVKESDLHIELKTFIAQALNSNKDYNKGIEFVAMEVVNRHISIPKIWKKPDVSSIYINKTLVFELQLSTTFLSVINSRQEFYKENNTFLIWIFSEFETDDERRKFTHSDVYYNNNRNGFVLDEQAKKKSLEENDLVLKCNYQKPILVNNSLEYEWASDYVKLSDLTFDMTNYKVFYYDVEGIAKNLNTQIELNESKLINILKHGDELSILELFANGYQIKEIEKKYLVEQYNHTIKPKEIIDGNTFEFLIILATICLKIDEIELIKLFQRDSKLRKTIIDILSLKLKKIIGCAFTKQIQISHRLIENRQDYLYIYLKAVDKYYPNLYYEQDNKFKFRDKTKQTKYQPLNAIEGIILINKIFPELDLK